MKVFFRHTSLAKQSLQHNSCFAASSGEKIHSILFKKLNLNSFFEKTVESEKQASKSFNYS